MSERDEENIDFVLSLDSKRVRDWITSMTTKEELNYALSIIECARCRLIDDVIEDEDDCTDAKQILNTIWKKE